MELDLFLAFDGFIFTTVPSATKAFLVKDNVLKDQCNGRIINVNPNIKIKNMGILL